MIRFSKYMWLYACISALILIPGVYSLIRFGLRPSVDFTGGTVMEFNAGNGLTEGEITDMAKNDGLDITTISSISEGQFLLGVKSVPEDTLLMFEQDIKEKSGETFTLLRKDTVGPILGKELMEKTVIAALVAIGAILLYVAYAFKNITYGVSAVVALIHDVLVMFGIFSLLGHFWGVEVDTLFISAFLTTMSFSVHDTIVIFDRIREYRHKKQSTDLGTLSDIALTETMGRSVVNSFTIIFMLLSLVLLGGETIRWFSVALLIGTITGTYSSPFVATPTLLLLDRWKKRQKQKN